MAVTVFLFCLLGNAKQKNVVQICLAAIGKDYSTWIYILHPIFIVVISRIAGICGIGNIYSYIAPFIVFIGTLCFLILVNFIIFKIRRA